LTIRAANLNDLEAIAAIWNPAIRDSLATFNSVEKTPQDLKDLHTTCTAQDHAFLVYEADGEVIGFAYYAQFRGGKGYAHTLEHTIYVAPTANGQGVGRALMSSLETHARDRGAHSIFAGVCAENPEGIAFHKACGYDAIARLPQVGRKFNRWLDLVLLQKHL